VATDIAARGIDVKDLDYIVHYHLPENAENYTHRSGRTARAGKTGISVCMIKPEQIAEINTLAHELEIEFRELIVNVNVNSIDKESYPINVSVNLGLSQGFTKNNLIEFLVEEAGLSSSDISKVEVNDNHSVFEIPSKFESQLILNLKGYKIAHRNVKLSITEA